MESKYLDTAEAAKILHISPRTLERMRCEGSPIPFTRAGRRVLYRMVDIEAYLEAGLTTTAGAKPYRR